MSLSPNSGLAREIQELLKRKDGPFKPKSSKAIISVPESYVVQRGFIFTWKNSSRAGCSILLEDKNHSKPPLELICKDTLGSRRDIESLPEAFFHINPEDFRYFTDKSLSQLEVFIVE